MVLLKAEKEEFTFFKECSSIAGEVEESMRKNEYPKDFYGISLEEILFEG